MGDWQRRGLNLKYLERIPTRYSSLVQLNPGHLGLARIEVRGQDSFIVRITTGARSIWTSVPEVDWVGYSIPITWKGDYLLNGMSATRNTVFKLDGAHEFDVVAESRDFVTCGIRRSVLSRMISGLIGRDFAISVNTYRQLQVPEAHRDRLLGILCKPLAWAPSNGSAATFGRLPRSVEVATIEAIANWTIEADQVNYSETVIRKAENCSGHASQYQGGRLFSPYHCRSLPHGGCEEVTTAPGILRDIRHFAGRVLVSTSPHIDPGEVAFRGGSSKIRKGRCHSAWILEQWPVCPCIQRYVRRTAGTDLKEKNVILRISASPCADNPLAGSPESHREGHTGLVQQFLMAAASARRSRRRAWPR
jgi:hypothetical protein